MKLRKTNKKGFTLVELIVVIAIIAIIAAIAIPTTIVYVGRAYDSSAQSEADSAYNTIVTFLQGGAASGLTPGAEVEVADIVDELNAINNTGVQYLKSATILYNETANTLTITVTTTRDPKKTGEINVADYELDFSNFKTQVTINYSNGWSV